jgi:hypothetical protein
MPTYVDRKQEKQHILTSQCRKRESATNSTNKKRENNIFRLVREFRAAASTVYRYIISINVAGSRIKGDLGSVQRRLRKDNKGLLNMKGRV